MLQFIIHDFARCPDAFTTLLPDRDQLAQLLDRFWLIAAHYFTQRFITHTITQTNVHFRFNSGTISDQSVNENGCYYNAGFVGLSIGMQILTGKKKEHRSALSDCYGSSKKPLPALTQLSDNRSNNARANGTAAFADCEAQTLVHRDWVDQGNNHLDVVARHDHLNAFWQLN